MEDNFPMIDAVPNLPLPNIHNENRNRENNNLPSNVLNCMLEEFTIDDYKSIFFLCLDYIKPDKILFLKKDKCILKERFYWLYYDKLNEKILVELLGTMKMYEHLKSINTCQHIYKNKQSDFNGISNIWKILFALCEEITDDHLQNLKLYMPEDIKDQILSAEEWFLCALQHKRITRTDLSYLKTVFGDNSVCLSIINKFKLEPQKYFVKTPTISNPYPCGLAVILNFETFDKASKLEPREGSDIDADSLKKLWTSYGFQTGVINNLKHLDVKKEIERYALMDHKDYNAFVCSILSHGDSNVFYASDGCSISIPGIINLFCDKSESLKTKPKLFFIQACQGTKIHQGAGEPVYHIKKPVKSTNYLEETTCPSHEDVLTVISTVDGYVSYRCPASGSYFIQTLYRVMLGSIPDNDSSILDIIQVVTDEVSKLTVDFGQGKPRKAKQIVSTFTTLTKKLILRKLKTT